MRRRPTPFQRAHDPRVVRATDEEAMRGIFQRRLTSLGAGRLRVVGCHIKGVRHVPGPRCVVDYSVRLEDATSEGERLERVSGTLYVGNLTGRARTRSAWGLLRAFGPKDGAGGLPPFFYVPEVGMLAQVFPFDRLLPGVAALVEGPPAELEPSLLARFGPGDWRLERWRCEVVRHLPESRFTARLTVAASEAVTGREAERRFYAKAHHEAATAREAHRVLGLLSNAGRAEGAFQVGSPIALLEELRTVVQDEVPGVPFKDIVLGQGDPIAPARSAATGLAAFHQAAVTPSRRLSVEWEVARTASAGETVVRSCPGLETEVTRIVRLVRERIRDDLAAPTHGDLGLGEMLLDGRRLGLVDLDAFAASDPVEDVVRVLSQLFVFGVQSRVPRDRARGAQEAFEAEYFSHVPQEWRESLAARYAGALVRRTVGVAAGPAPQNLERARALVDEAGASLAGDRPWRG